MKKKCDFMFESLASYEVINQHFFQSILVSEESLLRWKQWRVTFLALSNFHRFEQLPNTSLKTLKDYTHFGRKIRVLISICVTNRWLCSNKDYLYTIEFYTFHSKNAIPSLFWRLIALKVNQSINQQERSSGFSGINLVMLARKICYRKKALVW